jgi:hypothetical protein
MGQRQETERRRLTLVSEKPIGRKGDAIIYRQEMEPENDPFRAGKYSSQL